MRKTFIYNEDVKKSAFTIMMLQAMSLKLVDSTEVGFDNFENSDEETQNEPKYIRLVFQRENTEKSILFG
jgi:hypothetical protein